MGRTPTPDLFAVSTFARAVVYDYVPETIDYLRSRGMRLGIVSTKYRYRIVRARS